VEAKAGRCIRLYKKYFINSLATSFFERGGRNGDSEKIKTEFHSRDRRRMELSEAVMFRKPPRGSESTPLCFKDRL
jgi:hypothetical protein